LAVDRIFARRGLGSILLADAVKKTMAAAETVAMTVVIVDPIDDDARAFYAPSAFAACKGRGSRCSSHCPATTDLMRRRHPR
jgi:hypothetical protein